MMQYIYFLIGNAGGYLGLFLGYALLNVPELLRGALNWWNEKKNKARWAPGSAAESSASATEGSA